MGILRQALTGEYQPHGLESDANVILAFAFGRGDGVPGVVNEALAEFAVERAREWKIGIVAQVAVADAVENHLIQQAYAPADDEEDLSYPVFQSQVGLGVSLARIMPRDPAETHYMNSRQVLDQASRLIEPESTVMVVAQAFHAPRAVRQAQAAGYKTVLPEGLPSVWDPASIQQERHCRSAWAWARREPFAILHHQVLGWI